MNINVEALLRRKSFVWNDSIHTCDHLEVSYDSKKSMKCSHIYHINFYYIVITTENIEIPLHECRFLPHEDFHHPSLTKLQYADQN